MVALMIAASFLRAGPPGDVSVACTVTREPSGFALEFSNRGQKDARVFTWRWAYIVSGYSKSGAALTNEPAYREHVNLAMWDDSDWVVVHAGGSYKMPVALYKELGLADDTRLVRVSVDWSAVPRPSPPEWLEKLKHVSGARISFVPWRSAPLPSPRVGAA